MIENRIYSGDYRDAVPTKQIICYPTNRQSREPEVIFVNEPGLMLGEAKRILGNRFFGPDQISAALGFAIDSRFVESFPYTLAELKRFKEDRILMYFADEKEDGSPITTESLVDLMRDKTDEQKNEEPIINKLRDSYLMTKNGIRRMINPVSGKNNCQHVDRKGEAYYEIEKPRPGWRVISTEFLPDSIGRDSLEQTEALAAYLKNLSFGEAGMTEEIRAAVQEFEEKKAYLMDLMGKSREDTKRITAPWQEVGKILGKLKIRELTMMTPVEAVYAGAVLARATKRDFLKDMFTFTNRTTNDGGIIAVRNCGIRLWNEHYDNPVGDVVSFNPNYKYSKSGVITSVSNLPVGKEEKEIPEKERLLLTVSGYSSELPPNQEAGADPSLWEEMGNATGQITIFPNIKKTDLEVGQPYEEVKKEVERLHNEERWSEFLRANAVLRILYPDYSAEHKISKDDKVWSHLQDRVTAIGKNDPSAYIKWLSFSNLYTWAMISLAEEVKLTDDGLSIKMEKNQPDKKKNFPTIVKTEFKSKSWDEAKEIMGNDFLGEEALLNSFGGRLEDFGYVLDILRKPFPVPMEEIEKHKERQGYVILRPNRLPPENFITRADNATLAEVCRRFRRKFRKDSTDFDERWHELSRKDHETWSKSFSKTHKESQFLHYRFNLINQINSRLNDYKNEDFISMEIIPASVSLVDKNIVPGSLGIGYLRQLSLVADHLTNTIYQGKSLPSNYKEAILEFEREKSHLQQLLDMKNIDIDVMKKISQLKLNQLTRQSAGEAFFDYFIYFDNIGSDIGIDRYGYDRRRKNWTKTLTKARWRDGYNFVTVGTGGGIEDDPAWYDHDKGAEYLGQGAYLQRSYPLIQKG